MSRDYQIIDLETWIENHPLRDGVYLVKRDDNPAFLLGYKNQLFEGRLVEYHEESANVISVFFYKAGVPEGEYIEFQY